jgi:hypothetical protein
LSVPPAAADELAGAADELAGAADELAGAALELAGAALELAGAAVGVPHAERIKTARTKRATILNVRILYFSSCENNPIV